MSTPKLFLHICLRCQETVKREKAPPGEVICPHCNQDYLVLAPKKRKGYREVRVHDDKVPWGVSADLVLEIYPNGAINIRESGRRTRYPVLASAVYVAAVKSAVWRKKHERQLERKAQRARVGRQAARRR